MKRKKKRLTLEILEKLVELDARSSAWPMSGDDCFDRFNEIVWDHMTEILALAVVAIGRIGEPRRRGKYRKKSLGKAQARIVEAIRMKPRRVSELQADLGIDIGNCRRVLAVLAARGLARRDENRVWSAEIH